MVDSDRIPMRDRWMLRFSMWRKEEMKTLTALLITTDGKPVMTYAQFAELRFRSPRTVLNEICARKNPVPFWKDGGEWVCFVADVADWIERNRDAAINESERLSREYVTTKKAA